MAQAAGLTEELVSKAKQSRSEKKARKAMSKLGEYIQGFVTAVCTAVLLRPKIAQSNIVMAYHPAYKSSQSTDYSVVNFKSC